MCNAFFVALLFLVQACGHCHKGYGQGHYRQKLKGAFVHASNLSQLFYIATYILSYFYDCL